MKLRCDKCGRKYEAQAAKPSGANLCDGCKKPELVSVEEYFERQQWAWEHYHGIPICVNCQKMADCSFSPTSSCCLFLDQIVVIE